MRAALERVELGSDPRFGRRYPHQLSGGQQQRVTIAMACVCGPPVAVLDEPTTGLDVLTQDRILTELARLRSEEGMAMVYVTHDLAVVARMADRIVVMYAGRVVENGPVDEVIGKPRHPYTRALVGAIPDFRRPRALQGIPGVAVGVGEWPSGCAFAPRCGFEEERCRAAVPELEMAVPDHAVRCVRWSELELSETGPEGARAASPAGDGVSLLEVSDLEVEYRTGRTRNAAVRGVSFGIEAGRCVALVGESGSGKTTIGRCIAGLHVPTAGRIVFDGQELNGAARTRTLDQRRRIQIVFQNPFESLNPRHRVGASIERPLRVLRRLSRADAAREVDALLERVRLPARVAGRFPVELSGGERQRVAIARALAARARPARLRRGHLGARRVGAGGCPRTARRAAARPAALDALHHPQPRRGGVHQRLGARHGQGRAVRGRRGARGALDAVRRLHPAAARRCAVPARQGSRVGP